MSFWDYAMPHRLQINKSLRKAAEGLRERIDTYQIEYDQRVEACQEEIEAAEKEKQKSLEQFKESLINELHEEKELLKEVADTIASYVDVYLQRNYLYQMRNIKRKQIDILQEDNDFLSNQMKLIGEEIELLRDRQNELTSFTKVNDIIQLSQASGFNFNLSAEDDAKTLLDMVSDAIRECGDDQSAEKFALVRLKGLVQERSEYIPTIKYIAWVIQQKIQFSKQLSEKRNGVRDNIRDIRREIGDIEENIDSASKSLETIARQIRYYWAHPITYLSAEISYAYKEKNETSRQLKDVGEELHNMASWHSDDQDKWERLQRERRDLSSEVESLRDSIESKKRERKLWYEKRDFIFGVCKKFEAPLIPEKKADTDEKRIIEDRLIELSAIREAGVIEAEKIYEQERSNLVFEYEKVRGEMEAELASAEKQLEEKNADCEAAVTRVISAETRLKKLKEEDNRFFLVKMLSSAPEVEKAQTILASEKKTLGELKKKKKAVDQLIEEIEEKLAKLDKTHEKELRLCRPKYLRPTTAEANEEKRLLFRKDELENSLQGGRL